jgi:hypothetical protein
MKKTITTLVAIFALSQFSYAQWINQAGTGNYYLNSGNVGIGTAAPIYPLTLNGSSETGIVAVVNSTNIFASHGGWGLGAGRFGIGNGTVPTLVINTTANGGAAVGNIGIGTTTPKTKLQIAQDMSMNADVDAQQLSITGATDDAKRLVMGYDVNGAGFGYIKSGWYQHQWTNLALQPQGGNVGVGTTTPQSKLEVNSNVYTSTKLITFAGAEPTRFNANISYSSSNSTLSFGTRNDNTNYENTLNLRDNNVGIGTISPDARLTVNGTIHSKEVKVDTSIPVPDYVFASNYKLPSLEETKAFIDKNKHLPDIPSAKQMEKDGIKLGTMNILLLKKVEELTLHLIAQKEENQRLKDEHQKSNDEQQKINISLQQQINKIKNSK